MSSIKGQIWLIIATVSVLLSCDGTLGGFDKIRFPIKKEKLDIALDELFVKHPEYKIPSKWERYDNWQQRGYGFLDSRIFYFKNSPEEMYYISFIGENLNELNYAEIGIRAVHVKNITKWQLENDLSAEEKERIQERFKNEIILKLENYTGSESRVIE